MSTPWPHRPHPLDGEGTQPGCPGAQPEMELRAAEKALVTPPWSARRPSGGLGLGGELPRATRRAGARPHQGYHRRPLPPGTRVLQRRPAQNFSMAGGARPADDLAASWGGSSLPSPEQCGGACGGVGAAGPKRYRSDVLAGASRSARAIASRIGCTRPGPARPRHTGWGDVASSAPTWSTFWATSVRRFHCHNGISDTSHL